MACQACIDRLLKEFPPCLKPIVDVWNDYKSSKVSFETWAQKHENNHRVLRALQATGINAAGQASVFQGLLAVATMYGTTKEGHDLLTFCRASVGRYQEQTRLWFMTDEQKVSIQCVVNMALQFAAICHQNHPQEDSR